MKARKQKQLTPAQTESAEASKAPLSESDRAYVQRYFARDRQRIPTPRLKVNHRPPKPVEIALEKPNESVNAMAFVQAFGTTDVAFGNQLLSQLISAACPGGHTKPIEEKTVNALVAAMHLLGPRDELEAMLIAQMVATHAAAMTQLCRLKGAENLPQLEGNGSLATKLLRTFTAQMEALQRYRGKGQQKVTVEHVHVHSGGQAIVGNVSPGEPGGIEKNEEQPHAKAIAHAPQPAMPSPLTANRETLPSPCDG